jgi:hypothetical protein
MPVKLSKVDVYAADIMNRPGMLARILEALALGGANLEFVIARRVTANTSRVFVAPLVGKPALRAAADIGLVKATSMHVLRIEAPDRPALGATITRALAATGLNLRGLSAASVKKQSVCYIALASADDLKTAMKILKRVLSKSKG